MRNGIPTFHDQRYGAATDRLRGIVSAAHEVPLFPIRGPASEEEQGLVADHLAALASFFPSRLRASGIDWINGPLAVLDHLEPSAQPSDGWGDPYGTTRWGGLLLQLHLDVSAQIEADPGVRRLVGPPIWPMAAHLNVMGEALYESPPARDFQAESRWAMLEHMQYNYWRTLEWALLWPAGLHRSPFHSLFLLHLSGLYPVGFDSADRFRVYYRDEPDPREAAA